MGVDFSFLLFLTAPPQQMVTSSSMEGWIAIIAAILGPTGAAGIIKWISTGQEERLRQKDEQIKGHQEEIKAIKEEAHGRTEALLSELRTLLPALQTAAQTNREATETMETVRSWMETGTKQNEREMEIMEKCIASLDRNRDTLIALETKLGSKR